MKTIRFIYKPNPDMLRLIKESIADYGNDFLYGIMDEADKYQLRKRGLYLMCEEKFVAGIVVYSNPLAVVAKNQSDASRVYFEETEKNSTCMCDLESIAARAKVYPMSMLDEM